MQKQRLFLEQLKEISGFTWSKNEVEVNTYMNVVKVLKIISNTNPGNI
jgi:hypothetical protein